MADRPAAPAAGRLGAPAVEARLTRLEELLVRLESAPGPTSSTAVEAVRVLTEVYGEALARVLDLGGEPLFAVLAGDELLGHLLVLHDLHPEPAERRAERAVERLRPAVRERGGDVELVAVDGQVARVRVSEAGGCGAGCGGGPTIADAVREAVLAAAPELTAVEPVPMPDRAAAPAFVPLDSLLLNGAPRVREAP
ncbi:NifU family protein [Streptomyces pluripotens]|uniref:NifU family protein n=1 Tax=Streptomyces pluripotens TaxID=1355015 RepID=A0A221P766_9ACTN|nr:MULTISPECIES: NifU family protein [Streptomyces]ARP73689.1 NifU family protein [Streptomyces pluripotens]ASN27936.1 NifU family protein [Streptomyces pluripotens]KIE24353.1 nitrogen fixation protein NifU [Streptomyces sp. MUSC 125]MCH0559457.1 NifU family protein [Streptomyces sp. MUM 16J]